MSELLTAKDVEIKVFKKVRFGGYSVPEVEDFLNQVADDLDAYAAQIEEKDARIQELEAYAKKQDDMKEDIKEALIIARQAAKSVEEKAQADADKILADAQEQANVIINEADGKVQTRLDEAGRTAGDIIARAKASADELIQNTQDRREQADRSLAGIEQELAERRREAESQAENILATAKAEAHEYDEQIRYLSLKKQQFLKDTMSLILEFGKALDEAQQEIDAELTNSGNFSSSEERYPETEDVSGED